MHAIHITMYCIVHTLTLIFVMSNIIGTVTFLKKQHLIKYKNQNQFITIKIKKNEKEYINLQFAAHHTCQQQFCQK